MSTPSACEPEGFGAGEALLPCATLLPHLLRGRLVEERSQGSVLIRSLDAAICRFARDTADEGEFELLFRTYYPRLRGFFAVKSECTLADAEELTQTVLRRASRHRGQLQEIADASDFDRWLFTIAANLLRNWNRDRQAVRRRRVEESLDQAPDPSQLLARALREGGFREGDPYAACLEKEQLAAVANALRTLPDRMRRCAVHVFVHQRTLKETAEIMGIEVGTVKSQLHQARTKLRELLGPQFGPPELKDEGP